MHSIRLGVMIYSKLDRDIMQLILSFHMQSMELIYARFLL